MFARQIKSAGISLCQKLFILSSISSHARLYGLFYFTLSHHNHPEMWEEHFLKKYKKLHQGGLFLFFGLGIGKLNYNIFLFFWKNVRNFLRVIFFFLFRAQGWKVCQVAPIFTIYVEQFQENVRTQYSRPLSEYYGTCNWFLLTLFMP